MFLDEILKMIYIESKSKILDQEIKKLGIVDRTDTDDYYPNVKSFLYVSRNVSGNLYFARADNESTVKQNLLTGEPNMRIESEECFLEIIKEECKEWNSRKNKKEY